MPIDMSSSMIQIEANRSGLQKGPRNMRTCVCACDIAFAIGLALLSLRISMVEKSTILFLFNPN